MFSNNIWQTIIENDEISKAIAILKGKFDNLDVLPIEDLDDNAYALTIGKRKNSILLTTNLDNDFWGLKWVLIIFLEKLLEAINISGSICNFCPSKIFNTKSITIIPTIKSDILTKSQQIDYIKDLAKEWEISRIYLFDNGNNKSEILYHHNNNSPLHMHLMAEMLSVSSTIPLCKSENLDKIYVDFFRALEKFPSFIIKLQNLKINSTFAEINDVYNTLSEMLMLTMII